MAGRVDAHLAAAQEAVERVARHQPAIEQRRQRLPQARLTELGEQQRDVGILQRDGPADRQRAVERRFDEPRGFRFVREVEAGVDAGFERKFVQQRQAEGVDRADADVAERVADLAPALLGNPAFAMPLAQRRHHPLAHFRRGLAREGDREDVARRHARFQQAHVAIDQHPRLAGAGGGFECDVAQRIDRQPPRARVRGFLRFDRRALKFKPRLLRHCPLSLLCLLWPWRL